MSPSEKLFGDGDLSKFSVEGSLTIWVEGWGWGFNYFGDGGAKVS